MTSQLKVDRISPATGSEIIIDGFATGGRIVNTGYASDVDKISLVSRTVNHKVFEWTIDKVDPKNKVMCTVVVGGVYARTKSTTTSAGVVTLTTYISLEEGITNFSGDQVIGLSPPSNISNPRDNWIKAQQVHNFEINNDSQQLNLSLTAISGGDGNSDIFQINNDGKSTTLTWFEIEEI